MTTTKLCTKCNTVKPLTDYPKAVTNTDGHDNRCKACKSRLSQYYKQRREQGLSKPARRIKPVRDVQAVPFDPDLEAHRHLKNLINQFGIEGAKVKIKLERLAT